MSKHATVLVRPQGSPVASYVLASQVFPYQGLTGDRLPVFDRQRWVDGVGYGWPQGTAQTTWAETTTTTTGADTTHVVMNSARISQPSQWRTTISGLGIDVSWLRRVGTGRCFGIREVYQLDTGTASARSFYPTMAGSNGTFITASPSLLSRQQTSSGVTLIEGASIPLEYDPRGLIDPTSDQSTSTNEALAHNMTQYCQIGVNAGGDGVHQVDVWSYQPVWIDPSTEGPNRNRLSLESGPYLTNVFNTAYFYDVATQTTTPADIASANQFKDASLSRIDVTTNGVKSTLDYTPFSSQYAAVAYTSTSANLFTVALVAKLSYSSNGLSLPTTLRIGQNVSSGLTGIDNDTGQFVSVSSVSTAERRPGWSHIRYFLVTDSLLNVPAKINQLYLSGVMDSSSESPGFQAMRSFRHRYDVSNLA